MNNDAVTIRMTREEFDALYRTLNDFRAVAEVLGDTRRFDLIGYLVKRLDGKLPDPEPRT